MNPFAAKTVERKLQNIQVGELEIIVHFVFFQNILTKIFHEIDLQTVSDLWKLLE